MTTKKRKDSVSEIFIHSTQTIDRMERAIANIINNTIRLEDSVYKSGVLGNCEMALGKEKYQYYVDYYS